MAHSTNPRASVLLQCGDALRAGKIQPGCRTKNLWIKLSSVLNHIHQKRTIAPMPADQVKVIKASLDECSDHLQPEILKSAPTHVERAGESLAMGADPVWHD